MFPKKAHSLGGIATAKILKAKAIEQYYKNPNICLFCKQIIDVYDKKVSDVRKKKFCDQSCSAKYNNSRRPKKEKPLKKIKIKKEKSWSWLIDFTKAEIFNKHKNWQSARSSIRRHAKFIYDKKNESGKCENCNYDKHIEICHIKSVSSFDGNAFLSEINNKDNLIGLCPNCHWEFDNNDLFIAR